MDQTTEKKEYENVNATATVLCHVKAKQDRTYLLVKRVFDIATSLAALPGMPLHVAASEGAAA